MSGGHDGADSDHHRGRLRYRAGPGQRAGHPGGHPDDLPKPARIGNAREYFRHVQPRFYSPGRLAQDIVRGLDRNTALVIAPASARVAWYLWRYAPLVANRVAARQVAWARATFLAQPADRADVHS